MPIYEYRCRNGHTFEVVQSMNHEPIATCQVCSEPVERVFHPVAVHFKGSGFYSTDYGRNRAGASNDSGKDESKSDSKESKSDSKETTSTKTESSSAKSSSDSD